MAKRSNRVRVIRWTLWHCERLFGVVAVVGITLALVAAAAAAAAGIVRALSLAE